MCKTDAVAQADIYQKTPDKLVNLFANCYRRTKLLRGLVLQRNEYAMHGAAKWSTVSKWASKNTLILIVQRSFEMNSFINDGPRITQTFFFTLQSHFHRLSHNTLESAFLMCFRLYFVFIDGHKTQHWPAYLSDEPHTEAQAIPNPFDGEIYSNSETIHRWNARTCPAYFQLATYA